MDSTAFAELVTSRRSIRRFTPEPIPRADLEQILNAGRVAPSDTNAQPWHFVVVTDKERILDLEAKTQQRFADLIADLKEKGLPEIARKLKVFERYAAHFGSATALIIVCGEPYDSRFMQEVFCHLFTEAEMEQIKQEESIKSTSLAGMNMLLAAHAMGYGAVPMTGPVLAIPEQLPAPAGFQPHLVIAMGRPDGRQLPVVPRKPLDEITTWIE